MSEKRILTIQDVSCVGQCSLTVALPILSACGLETGILPSAVLSTHTGGFKGYTFRDLTEDMPKISAHWKKEGITFDAIYTGYLGSEKQIDYVRDIFAQVGAPGCVKIVDPAMADNGKLYPGFDAAFARKMGTLCAEADVVLPNITEACLLTDTDYRETYDEDYIAGLTQALIKKGARSVVLTGVSYEPHKIGALVCEKGVSRYYSHERMEGGSHGTGDVFASAFTGAYMRQKSMYDAARIACDFTVACIKNTGKEHWYGVRFERMLPMLINRIES